MPWGLPTREASIKESGCHSLMETRRLRRPGGPAYAVLVRKPNRPAADLAFWCQEISFFPACLCPFLLLPFPSCLMLGNSSISLVSLCQGCLTLWQFSVCPLTCVIKIPHPETHVADSVQPPRISATLSRCLLFSSDENECAILANSAGSSGTVNAARHSSQVSRLGSSCSSCSSFILLALIILHSGVRSQIPQTLLLLSGPPQISQARSSATPGPPGRPGRPGRA